MGHSDVVKFLLQNINAEQSNLESKSEQYKEYQALKREAHDNAIEANKDIMIDKKFSYLRSMRKYLMLKKVKSLVL